MALDNYDGDGLRRQTVTSLAMTKFIWYGQDVLLETDGNGTTQVTCAQTPNLYGDLVSQRPAQCSDACMQAYCDGELAWDTNGEERGECNE